MCGAEFNFSHFLNSALEQVLKQSKNLYMQSLYFRQGLLLLKQDGKRICLCFSISLDTVEILLDIVSLIIFILHPSFKRFSIVFLSVSDRWFFFFIFIIFHFYTREYIFHIF